MMRALDECKRAQIRVYTETNRQNALWQLRTYSNDATVDAGGHASLVGQSLESDQHRQVIGEAHAAVDDKLVGLANIVLSSVLNLLDNIVKVITDVMEGDVGNAGSGKQAHRLLGSKGQSGGGKENEGGELHNSIVRQSSQVRGEDEGETVKVFMGYNHNVYFQQRGSCLKISSNNHLDTSRLRETNQLDTNYACISLVVSQYQKTKP